MAMSYLALSILIVLLVWVIFAFNSFVSRMNRTRAAWADIDVQLKRRYDLIPNLVDVVKGYGKHERAVLEAVTAARVSAMQASSVPDHAASENMLTDTLRSLFMVSEAYPDLKANHTFLELQRALSETEDQIQAARRFYNGSVRDLNTAIEQFPGNLVAGVFRFKKRDLFELSDSEESARKPVPVTL